MSEHNGWKNFETWNVALWLQNDEYYYSQLKEFCSRPLPAKSQYLSFVRKHLQFDRTPDGVSFKNSAISKIEMNKFLLETRREIMAARKVK